MLQYRHCIRIEVGSRVEFICHQYCAFALITVVVVGVHTGLVAKIQVWNCSAGLATKPFLPQVSLSPKLCGSPELTIIWNTWPALFLVFSRVRKNPYGWSVFPSLILSYSSADSAAWAEQCMVVRHNATKSKYATHLDFIFLVGEPIPHCIRVIWSDSKGPSNLDTN